MTTIDDIIEEDPVFRVMLKENKPYVTRFCEKYGVELLEARPAVESEEFELAYTFSDGLGGYTIRGIKSSL